MDQRRQVIDERWRDVRAAALAATRDWRDLVALSRPGAWAVTAVPYAVGAFEGERAISPALIIGVLYFLAPYNLLLRGVDQTVAGDAPEDRAASIRFAIAITNLPFLIVMVLLGGAMAGVALALALMAAIADAVPPLRTRDRPGVDVLTSAACVVLPAVCGLLLVGVAPAGLPWIALLALFAWVVASATLRRIEAATTDRAAGRTTIATAAGPRTAAMIAMTGYAAAAAAAATIGTAGLFAAAGLLLFLLLPAMVLSAPRESAAQTSAARRAWRDLPGLAAVSGAWMGLLLLRHWEIVRFSAWGLAVAATTIAVGWALANVVATRLATRRRRPGRLAETADVPSLTVVVACHDDADRLPATLSALRRQTYADTWILVVDAGSTDASVATAIEVLGPWGQVVEAPPIPDGWTGPSWACQVGAEAAITDLLLFVDSSTDLHPVAARILVEQSQVRRDDLLSGVTRFDMRNPGERAAVPGLALLLFGFVPIWWSALTRGRPWPIAFAYRPCILVRRAAYLAAGGHAASPSSRRPGIDLARTMARAGSRVGTVHVADIAATRQDRDVSAAVGSWRGVLGSYAGTSLALAIVTIAVLVLAFAAPLVLPAAALLADEPPAVVATTLIPLAVLVLVRFVLALTQRQPLLTILWHPATVIIALIGQVSGIADHVLGRGLEQGG